MITRTDLERKRSDARASHARRRAAKLRAESEAFARFAAGYGVVRHEDDVQVRVHALARRLVDDGAAGSVEEVYDLLAAADRIASAGMWLVVHMTYARRVRTGGEDLEPDDFKPDPQGHTGGALNMVPAYVGYLAANALSGVTRGWTMGQGHCVAAIDAVNLLVGNLTPAHAERYGTDDAGLTRLVRDFYSYEIEPDGRPASPLGSHVGPHTAGGTIEGGYLGFAELQYVHQPLPGERLVVFLSDGAFEEQRGGDWAPRWWRGEDSGLVAPIMIANGRRIDQRTTLSQQGGTEWFLDHLRHHGFDPFRIDGRDPAAFACAIAWMDERLAACADAAAAGALALPVPLPYAVAEAPKGFGFPGAGTNRAHNLPLAGNPALDEAARAEFRRGARALWVAPEEVRASAARLATHARQGRPLERDHPLVRSAPVAVELPELPLRAPEPGARSSPMTALDRAFCAFVRANPRLRPRVGNPDEMRSNRMEATLELLRHRVTDPEEGLPESVLGGVITALNEEAVVSAALANKGGINLVVTYEAFAVKMLGAARQVAIFARNQREAGVAPGWLGVPIVCTSHAWENGKNEHSHQDPTFAEALLGESGEVARVLFPPDANAAVEALRACYEARGTVFCLVVPKNAVPERLDPDAARRLARDGAVRARGTADAPVQLVAVGAYQLDEAWAAADRLESRGIAAQVVALGEPGRFREPRDAGEARAVASKDLAGALFPEDVRARVLLTHVRPEPLIGALRPLDLGRRRTRFLGFQNRGGTLDVFGMLFANRCTWAHAVAAAADAASIARAEVLDPEELAAVEGRGRPEALRR